MHAHKLRSMYFRGSGPGSYLRIRVEDKRHQIQHAFSLVLNTNSNICSDDPLRASWEAERADGHNLYIIMNVSHTSVLQVCSLSKYAQLLFCISAEVSTIILQSSLTGGFSKIATSPLVHFGLIATEI